MLSDGWLLAATLKARSTTVKFPARSLTFTVIVPLAKLVTGAVKFTVQTPGADCENRAASSAPAGFPFTAKFVTADSEFASMPEYASNMPIRITPSDPVFTPDRGDETVRVGLIS